MMFIMIGTTMFAILTSFVLLVLRVATKDSYNTKISKDIIHYFSESDDNARTIDEIDELVEFSKNNMCSYKL